LEYARPNPQSPQLSVNGAREPRPYDERMCANGASEPRLKMSEISEREATFDKIFTHPTIY